MTFLSVWEHKSEREKKTTCGAIPQVVNFLITLPKRAKKIKPMRLKIGDFYAVI